MILNSDAPVVAIDPDLSLRGRTTPPAEALPVVRIVPARGWVSLKLRELWAYRELLYF